MTEGLGFNFCKPRLSKAGPKPGLSGRAGPAHHYSNPNLQRSLEESYGTIVQVLNGSVGHPLLKLWLDWTSKHGWNSSNHLAKVDATLNFQNQFYLNILPGDLTLIQGFALTLQCDLGPSDFHFLNEVAMLLFKVVTMRVYLGRNPCDDEQIFYLAYNPSNFGAKLISPPDDPFLEAKHGSIVRNLTIPERVLLGSKSSHRLRHLVADDIPLPQDFQLAEVLDALGEPYQFFSNHFNWPLCPWGLSSISPTQVYTISWSSYQPCNPNGQPISFKTKVDHGKLPT